MKARQCVFPRWRGFNLLGMFCSEESEYRDFRSPGYYTEEDFKMIRDWGFDFVRLPLSYRLWSNVDNPYEIEESKIAPLDEAIYFAEFSKSRMIFRGKHGEALLPRSSSSLWATGMDNCH